MKKLTILLGVLLMAMPVMAAVQVNAPAPAFTLTDSNNQEHSLSDFKGKYVVLEWVNYDCPFVKKHYKNGDMQNLQKDLTGKDVVWLSINSSAAGKQGAYSSEEVNQIIENSSAAPSAYLLDTDGTVGKMYGAKTTPHMFVINPEGNLIYQGAIDSISSFEPSDVPTADNYVVKALSEAMEGATLSAATTKPYGCSVKY